TFSQWVCGLTSALLTNFYHPVAARCFATACASRDQPGDRGGGMAITNEFFGLSEWAAGAAAPSGEAGPHSRKGSHGQTLPPPVLEGQDEMLSLCFALCKRNAHVAACLFPAIIYDLLRSHEPSSSSKDPYGAEGVQNIAKVHLSAAFREHLFREGGQGVEPRAVALAVETLDYLRGCQ
ncbi:unnamed protein product, partial [Discosporangium mesarthrocarpum]